MGHLVLYLRLSKSTELLLQLLPLRIRRVFYLVCLSVEWCERAIHVCLKRSWPPLPELPGEVDASSFSLCQPRCHPCFQSIAPILMQKVVERESTGMQGFFCHTVSLHFQGRSSSRVCVQYLRKYKHLYFPQSVAWKPNSCIYMVKGNLKLYLLSSDIL